MRLWIASDFHYEIYGLPDCVSPPQADIFVCAGDLMRRPAEGIKWLEETIPFPSIYVAGNHEYYNGIYTSWRDEAAADTERSMTVHCLENSVRVLDDIRFVGCTLWTDFALFGDDKVETAKQMAERGMNDYSQISYAKGVGELHWKLARFTPNHTARIHAGSRAYLDSVLSQPFLGRTVVVTHHAPSALSIHGKYGQDWKNAAYASDLTGLIERHQPDLWIHGHVHSSFDYMVGKTRIVCNPKGYQNENPDFDPNLVIKI